MNKFNIINNTQDLNKIKTIVRLNQISLGNKNGKFNTKLDPVHLNTNNGLPHNSKKPSFFVALKKPLTVSGESKKNFLINPIAQNTKGLVNLQSPRVSDLSKQNSLFYPETSEPKKFSSLVNRGTLHEEYLTNNIEHISLNPIIGIKNGLLLKYKKFVSYSFNGSTINPKEKRFSENGPTTLLPLVQESPRVSGKGALVKQASQSLEKIGGNMPVEKPRVVLSKNKEITDTIKLLNYFFKSIYCLISKPVFIHSADKLTIQLFYFLNIPQRKLFKYFSITYINSFKNKWLKKKSQAFSIRKNKSHIKLKLNRSELKIVTNLRNKSNIVRNLFFKMRNFNISKVYYKKFELICKILSKKFNKTVEFQLIRLHNPLHDTNILANLFSLNLNNKKFYHKRAIEKIITTNEINIISDPSLKAINLVPAYLSGISIKIAGRLMREAIVPRMTTRFIERGASSIGKVNYLDVGTINKKNKKGAYTITIQSGQNFYLPKFNPLKKKA